MDVLQRVGCTEIAGKSEQDVEAVFHEIDANGGGIVLFDEFAHWALNHHIRGITDHASDKEDREKALELLRGKEANLARSTVDCAVHHGEGASVSLEIREEKSMVMKFNGNVRGEVRVKFLALLPRNPIFSCAVPSNCPELFARTLA